MALGVAPSGTNNTPDVPTIWRVLAAGTRDLVSLDPTGSKRCARKIVATAADTWTMDPFDQQTQAATAVPAGFVHIGATAAITCTASIIVYW